MDSGDLDPSVLAGLRARDVRALEDCYRVFGARVYRLCRGLLGQVSDAEDATQEIFLKLLARAGQFEGRARFSTWLHRLTVNHCLSRLERERARRADRLELVEEPLVDSQATPLEVAQVHDERRRVESLLSRVPTAQRTVLVLRELEGLAYAEIAEVLDLPVGTVMSRLARGRERLTALVTSALPPSRSVS